jgi:hypothetical protein
MNPLLPLPLAPPARSPDTRVLLPLDQYDLCIVSVSGGKGSLAVALDLLERGVPHSRVQLWHQCVDGDPGADEPFMDWPCTLGYVRAVGRARGVRVLCEWRLGGFLGEVLKDSARTRLVRFVSTAERTTVSFYETAPAQQQVQQ